MKRIRRKFWRWIAEWGKIPLIDRCLLLIMCVLLLQTAYNAFFNLDLAKQYSSIDTVVRTASASIFGYFISANFNKHFQAETETSSPPQPHSGESTDTDYVHQEKKVSPKPQNKEGKPVVQAPRSNDIQVLVTTAICLFSLAILLVLRNSSYFYFIDSDTVSQLQDFASGSVGFLIGSPTQMKGKKEGE